MKVKFQKFGHVSKSILTKNILKWQPKWKIKKAVEETYRWYENFYNKKDINYLTMKEIKDFFKL